MQLGSLEVVLQNKAVCASSPELNKAPNNVESGHSSNVTWIVGQLKDEQIKQAPKNLEGSLAV